MNHFHMAKAMDKSQLASTESCAGGGYRLDLQIASAMDIRMMAFFSKLLK